MKRFTPHAEADLRAYGLLGRVRDAVGRFKAGQAQSRAEAAKNRAAADLARDQAHQDRYATHFEWQDREGNFFPEHFEKASDNALHYSHYETHHAPLLKKMAAHHGISERAAAVDLANHAGDHGFEEHAEGEGHKWRGPEGHRRLARYVTQGAREEMRDA